MKHIYRFSLVTLLIVGILGVSGCGSKPESAATGTADDQYWKKGGSAPAATDPGAAQAAQKGPH